MLADKSFFSKARLEGILNGTDPQLGHWVASFLHVLIILTAVAFAMSTVPDLPQELRTALRRFETFVIFVFMVEYLLRLYAADRPLRYVFSFWGIIDLLAWLPFLLISLNGTHSLRLLRLLRAVRILKLVAYGRAIRRLELAFEQVWDELVLFFFIAMFLIYISSVGIYMFEYPAQPDVFSSVPASLWWSIVTLTTVGYGDIIPITFGGRVFTTVILLLGLGIFAVPAGIITSALIGQDLEGLEDSLEKLEASDEKSRRKRRIASRRGT